MTPKGSNCSLKKTEAWGPADVTSLLERVSKRGYRALSPKSGALPRVDRMVAGW